MLYARQMHASYRRAIARAGMVRYSDSDLTLDDLLLRLRRLGPTLGRQYAQKLAELLDSDPGLRRRLAGRDLAMLEAWRERRDYGEWHEEDHPRGQPDNAGQFGPGGGAKKQSAAKPAAKGKAAPQAHPGATHGSSVTIKPSKQRAFDGANPVAIKKPLTKQETGRVGEAVVLAWLKSQGFADAKPMNSAATNFPIDLIEDHRPTEVKAGLASNGRKAQQWRLTFSKETKSEIEAYDKMTPAEREAWNAHKQARIKERKLAVIKSLEKKYGKPINPRTITVVINPDTRTADLYAFDGFHDRIDWQSDIAKKSYVGSVTYAH